jgi:ribose/xylose/arabinose/galactoside ABC-type transport system permease subunit
MERMKKIVMDYRIPMLAVVIFLFMSFTNEYFFKPVNMTGLFESISAYGIVAVGFTFVLLCGQLDISMGSVMALTACVFMMTLPTIGFIPAMLLSFVLGCVCGAITGFFVATFRLPPFIVSMTMQLAYKGIALTITNSTPVSNMHPTLLAISEMKLGPIPMTFFLFLAVALIAEYVLTQTQYGRNLYVIGGNINVADNLGLHVRRHLWSVFHRPGLLRGARRHRDDDAHVQRVRQPRAGRAAQHHPDGDRWRYGVFRRQGRRDQNALGRNPDEHHIQRDEHVQHAGKHAGNGEGPDSAGHHRCG